jgi:hypothetical protein
MLHGFPISAKLPDDPGFGERFWYWRGASGRTYIHSIYRTGDCPPLPGAVYVAVHHRDGRREPVAAGRFPPEWNDWDLPAGAQPGTADEVHVHLLARDEAAAVDVLNDMRAALLSPIEEAGQHPDFDEASARAVLAS